MVRILKSGIGRVSLLLTLMTLLAGAESWAAPGMTGGSAGGAMPEFTATSKELWVNSKPLKRADLKGKVLLLEVWTSI